MFSIKGHFVHKKQLESLNLSKKRECNIMQDYINVIQNLNLRLICLLNMIPFVFVLYNCSNLIPDYCSLDLSPNSLFVHAEGCSLGPLLKLYSETSSASSDVACTDSL